MSLHGATQNCSVPVPGVWLLFCRTSYWFDSILTTVLGIQGFCMRTEHMQGVGKGLGANINMKFLVVNI